MRVRRWTGSGWELLSSELLLGNDLLRLGILHVNDRGQVLLLSFYSPGMVRLLKDTEWETVLKGTPFGISCSFYNVECSGPKDIIFDRLGRLVLVSGQGDHIGYFNR